MRRYKYSIGILVAFVCLTALYAFANKRNEKREFEQRNVRFVDQQNRFLSKATVNKLLIQNEQVGVDEKKEILALKQAEQEVQSLAHVKAVEVYHSVNHKVGVLVEEHVPIARLFSGKPKYISTTGDLMPLASDISVRVPIVYGFKEIYKDEIVSLIEVINKDAFLKQNVVGITCLKDKDFSLDLRDVEANVVLGGLSDMETKVKNLKIFFVKAKKDGLLKEYKQLSLKVKNQVICTKK